MERRTTGQVRRVALMFAFTVVAVGLVGCGGGKLGSFAQPAPLGPGNPGGPGAPLPGPVDGPLPGGAPPSDPQKEREQRIAVLIKKIADRNADLSRVEKHLNDVFNLIESLEAKRKFLTEAETRQLDNAIVDRTATFAKIYELKQQIIALETELRNERAG